MPPSLYLRNLRTLSGALSIPNSQRFILTPLTLTLSPGRGNRFVDAGNMLKMFASQKVCGHNNPPSFPNPEPGEMAPSAPFSPCGRRAGDEGEANLQAALSANTPVARGTSPKRSTR